MEGREENSERGERERGEERKIETEREREKREMRVCECLRERER